MRAGNCPLFLTFYKNYDIFIIELNERRKYIWDIKYTAMGLQQ